MEKDGLKDSNLDDVWRRSAARTFADILHPGIQLQALRRGGPWCVQQSCIANVFLTILLVVLLKSGPSAGQVAVIAEIIDHNRVRYLSSMIFITTLIWRVSRQ